MDALPHVKFRVAITARASPRSALLCLKFVEIQFYQVLRLVMTEILLTETGVRLLVLFKLIIFATGHLLPVLPFVFCNLYS